MRCARGQQESERYARALSDLQSWRRSMLRLLTLDTSGVGLLLVVAVVRPGRISIRKSMEGLRQYAPYIATSVGVVLAVLPVVGIWAERHRGPIGLL